MNIYKALNFLRNTLETVAVASVRSIKKHIFKVTVTNSIKVSNLPKVQNVEGKVKVTNQISLTELSEKMDKVVKSIQSLNIPDNIEVRNFPKVPDPVREVTVKNQPKEVSVSNLKTVLDGLGEVRSAISKLPTKYPEVRIPEPLKPLPFPKAFEILNPIKNVIVDNLEKLKSKDPEEYVPVRLSDGEEFYNALTEVAKGSSGRYTFQKLDGSRGQALMDNNNRAIVFSDEFHLIDRRTINLVKFLGFEDKYGTWYIMTIEGTGQDPEDQKFRFATNKNNPTINTYVGAWNNKLTLIFGRYSDAFGS